MDARICRWLGGKQAALSFRFDDSHPTHVENAAPILNDYGFAGTFMVNPGRENHQNFRDAWEGSIIQQGHELANHTFIHRGAETDQEAEAEVGKTSEYIWRVQPDRGRLLAFARGGGTVWTQRKSIEYLLKRYPLFRCGNSMSCSEVYEHFSVDRFKERLDRTIEEGKWLQTHFHCIGPGYLNISVATFRQLLDYARDRGTEVWQAGMAEIYKYQEERDGSMLMAHADGDDTLALRLVCTTVAELYNQPLTLEVDLPPQVDKATVLDAAGKAVESRVEEGVVRFEVDAADADFTVRAEGLGSAYLAANGADVAAAGPHPYVFFSSDDVPALKEKAGRVMAAEMWARVKQEADRLIGPDAPEVPEGATTLEQARPASGRLPVLGLAYALTGDAAYAQRAAQEVEVILAADTWSHPQHNSEADLVSAEITCSLGVAYDWMHDALPEDLRARMREAMILRGLEPIEKATREGVWWTHWYRGNWGSVIYGQAGVAALSLLADEPRAADWVRRSWGKIWGYGQALGMDGSWGESVSYGCYAWSNATLFMDALHHVTGGRVDLFDNPRLRALPEWFIHMLVPDESGFVPFSNCGKGTAFRGQYLYRLAKAYGDGRAQWIGQRMAAGWGSQTAFGFLWCDPDLTPTAPTDLPTARIFDHTDWAVMRGRWEDAKATLFGFKGGQKDWDHYHHDMNHFVLYAHGKPLIVDLFYPHKIWGCETEAHNTILVNNRDQAGVVRVQGCRGNPDHRGVIGDLMETPWYVRLVGDASAAYEPDDVNSFVREVMFLRKAGEGDPPDYFVMFDDVDATGPMPMDWLLHTYGEMSVDGNRVTVVQDDAAADVTMVLPEALTCEVIVRDIEEAAGSQLPFEGAKNLTYVKLRPTQPTARGYFVSVISPRPASASPSAAVTAIQGPNTHGARIVSGRVEDVALFALDAPEMAADGVTAAGRSCLVRRVDGKVTGAVLHGGQKLTVDGATLYETDNCGHAVLTVRDDGIDAKLALFNNRSIWIYADRRPSRVLVDGADRAFDYEADAQRVRLDYGRMRDVQVIF